MYEAKDRNYYRNCESVIAGEWEGLMKMTTLRSTIKITQLDKGAEGL